jgi:hypothetical protein
MKCGPLSVASTKTTRRLTLAFLTCGNDSIGGRLLMCGKGSDTPTMTSQSSHEDQPIQPRLLFLHASSTLHCWFRPRRVGATIIVENKTSQIKFLLYGMFVCFI